MSTPFLGSDFRLQSVTHVGLATLRVRFTQDPRVVDENDVQDALNIDNYSVSGPAENYVIGSSIVLDDPQSIDLYMAAPLKVGDWILSASPNIDDENGAPLEGPFNMAFAVAFVTNPEGQPKGAVNDDVVNVLRKFFNPGLKGRNWDSVLEALAAGDRVNWENAKLAFDQLFLSTASGIYLDRRAGDQGQTRPPALAMPDDLFRDLTIVSKTSKLTQDALLEVLEVFYGSDAVRASITSDATETYNFEDGDDLTILLDERDEVTLFFVREDFARIGVATPLEVAISISRQLRERGTSAYAVVHTNDDGEQAVRIYSGRLGISSAVKVLGGKAQRRLLFPLQLFEDVGEPYPTWDITASPDNPGYMRFQLDDPASISFQNLVDGDVLLAYGTELHPLNRGTFTISNVVWEYDGPDLIQYFEVENAAGVEQLDLTQLTFDGLLFHRPQRRTIYNVLRHCIVSQSEGRVDIIIPTTTQAVVRQAFTAAYLNLRAPAVATFAAPFDDVDPEDVAGEAPPPDPVPALSSYVLDQDGGSTSSVGAGAETLVPLIGNRVVDWDAIPGTTLRIGFAGHVAVGGGTTTVRIRAEGTARNVVDGTVIHTFTATGSAAVLEEIEIAKPSGASYLKITVENGGATTTITGGNLFIASTDEENTGMILNHYGPLVSGANGVEVLVAQWIVDFDDLGDTANILVGLGGLFSMVFTTTGKECRVRIGGTVSVATDGTEVILHNETSSSEVTRGLEATIAKPSGVQPVKLTLRTNDGFGGFPINLYDPSIVVRAA